MRIAAGILMLVAAITFLIAAVRSSAAQGGWETLDNLAGISFLIFVLAWVGFFIIGGVFCLQGKHWGLCFTSSLLLTLSVIISFFFGLTSYLVDPLGILPIVFVCLRKREWES